MYRFIFRKLTNSGLVVAVIPIVVLICIGTLAYAVLEDWPWLDALYATIITITTVGYGDLSPQTLGGRIFAIFFTLSAIGLASYAISTLAAIVIDWEHGRIKRRVQEHRMETIAALEGHVILCGATNIGRIAGVFFQRGSQPFVLVEKDEEALRRALLYLDEAYLQKKFGRYKDITQAVDVTEEEQLSLEALTQRVDVPYLLADPTDDSALLAAGIHQARGLVAALGSDELNLFTVVSARALATQLDNPQLRIMSLVHDDKNGTKLQIAGADQLIFPEKWSGMQIQKYMLNPILSDFWAEVLYHDASHAVHQFETAVYPAWIGQTVAALREKYGLLILGIRRNGDFHYAPDAQEVLQAGDDLIAFGPRQKPAAAA